MLHCWKDSVWLDKTFSLEITWIKLRNAKIMYNQIVLPRNVVRPWSCDIIYKYMNTAFRVYDIDNLIINQKSQLSRKIYLFFVKL